MKKTLQIKGQIDKILLNRRLISRNFESNFSKTREIMTDFEEYIDALSKNIDPVTLKNRLMELVYLTKLISEVDEFLSYKIEPQWGRILRNKHVKPLIKEVYNV